MHFEIPSRAASKRRISVNEVNKVVYQLHAELA